MFIFRTFGNAMENDIQNWALKNYVPWYFIYIPNICNLGHVHDFYSGRYGGDVGVFAHITAALVSKKVVVRS